MKTEEQGDKVKYDNLRRDPCGIPSLSEELSRPEEQSFHYPVLLFGRRVPQEAGAGWVGVLILTRGVF